MASSIPPHNITQILRTDVGSITPTKIESSKAPKSWETVASKIGEIAKENFKNIGDYLKEPYIFKIRQDSHQEFIVEIFKEGPPTTPLCTIQTTPGTDDSNRAFKEKVEAIWKALFDPTFSISGQSTSQQSQASVIDQSSSQPTHAAPQGPTGSPHGVSGFEATGTGSDVTQSQDAVDFGKITSGLNRDYHLIAQARDLLQSDATIPPDIFYKHDQPTRLRTLITFGCEQISIHSYSIALTILQYNEQNRLHIQTANRLLDFTLLADIQCQLNSKNLRAALISIDLLQEPLRSNFLTILGVNETNRATPLRNLSEDKQNAILNEILKKFDPQTLISFVNVRRHELSIQFDLEMTKVQLEEKLFSQQRLIKTLEAREAAILEQITIQTSSFEPTQPILDPTVFSPDDPAHKSIQDLAAHLRSLNDTITPLEATAYVDPSAYSGASSTDQTTISALQEQLAKVKADLDKAIQASQQQRFDALKHSSTTDLSTPISTSQEIQTDLTAPTLNTPLEEALARETAAKAEIEKLNRRLEEEIALQTTKSEIALQALTGDLTTISPPIPANLKPAFQTLAAYFAARIEVQKASNALERARRKSSTTGTLESTFDAAKARLETCKTSLESALSTDDPQVEALIAYALATQGSDQMAFAQEERIRGLTIQLQATQKELADARSQNATATAALAAEQASKAEIVAQNAALQAQVQALTTDKTKLEQALQSIATSVGFSDSSLTVDALNAHIAKKLADAELRTATAQAAAHKASGEIATLTATLAEEEERFASLSAAQRERSLAIQALQTTVSRSRFETLDLDALPKDLTDIESLLALGLARCRQLSDALNAATTREAEAKASAASAQAQLRALQEAQEHAIAAGIATTYERINTSLLPLYQTLTGTELRPLTPENLESQLATFQKGIFDARRISQAQTTAQFDQALKKEITTMLRKMGISIIPKTLASDSSRPINLNPLFRELGSIITTHLTGAGATIPSLKAEVVSLTETNEALRVELSRVSSAMETANKEIMQARAAAAAASKRAEDLEAVVRDASSSAQAATIAQDEALRRASATERALAEARAEIAAARESLDLGTTRIHALTDELKKAQSAATRANALLKTKEQELAAQEAEFASLSRDAAAGRDALERYFALQARNRALFTELETLKAAAARRAGSATASASIAKAADSQALYSLRIFVVHAAQFIASFPNDDYLPAGEGKTSKTYKDLIQLAPKDASVRSSPAFGMSVEELSPHVDFIEKVLQKIATTKPLHTEAAKPSTTSGGFLGGVSSRLFTLLGSTPPGSPATGGASSVSHHVKVVPSGTTSALGSHTGGTQPSTVPSSGGSAASASATTGISRVPLAPRGRSTVGSVLRAPPASIPEHPTSSSPTVSATPTDSSAAAPSLETVAADGRQAATALAEAQRVSRGTILSEQDALALSAIGGSGTRSGHMRREESLRLDFGPTNTRSLTRAHPDSTNPDGIGFTHGNHPAKPR